MNGSLCLIPKLGFAFICLNCENYLFVNKFDTIKEQKMLVCAFSVSKISESDTMATSVNQLPETLLGFRASARLRSLVQIPLNAEFSP